MEYILYEEKIILNKEEVMIVKLPKLILLFMIILSWATTPFIGWRNFKRYLPSTFFISFILMNFSYIGKKYKWWKFHNNLSEKFTPELPFILGPFTVGTLWVMKWFYGKPGKFIAFNTIVDLLFAYPMTKAFAKLKIYELKRIKHFQFFLIFYVNVFLLYGFQKVFIERD
ncbi:hypothetical protein [Alkalibacillus haloalkaliphilus]|uniref:hypothetical protein n=1 Tax=Alkalibacillus haloalkaliphilus TaxID=94136 RepID=UPI002936B98B|nr:hypothetical protein [Alkalibacillus haloalkaliphilus]MDV2582889.1 hypothetical protein [Alkalibacillus haloalkaliphilus]